MKVQRVLTIAAHPDDELIGVGGTIRKLVDSGSEAQAIIACSGELLHEVEKNTKNVKNETKKAASFIGYNKIHFLDYPDQKLDTYSVLEVAKDLEKIIESFRPDTVFIQFYGDVNQDHKRLFEAALIAIRPVSKFIQQVFAYETLSSTEWGFPREFRADTFVDISEQINAKCNAMECYETELRDWPHPRSIEGIISKAKSNGSTICVSHAERFMTIWRCEI